MKCLIFLCSTAMAIGLLSAEVTLAQSEQKGLSTIDLKGELESLSPNQISLKGDDKKDYTVVFDPSRVNFQYKGTSDLGILSSGLFVRFRAAFDQQGNATGPIQELEVFSPKAPHWLTEQELMEQTPGIYPIDTEEDAPVHKSRAADGKKSNSTPGKTDSKNSENKVPSPRSSSTARTNQNNRNAGSSRDKRSPQSSQPQSRNNRLNPSPGASDGSIENATEYRIVGRILIGQRHFCA